MLARVCSALLAPQPLAVDEPRAGELYADPGPGEALDGLAVEPLRSVAFAQERPRASLDTERPVRAAGSCRHRKLLERVRRQLGRAAPCGRLNQLDQGPSRPAADQCLLMTGCRLGRLQRLLVLGEAVAEHRAVPVCDGDGGPLATRDGLPDRGIEQLAGLALTTTPGSQSEWPYARRVAPDRRTHRADLFEQRRGGR